MTTVDLSTSPTATTGRPRDHRIDGAVLDAARELVVEVGYLNLTIAAVAERAGTTKPAIYRRWSTKAHLVHEAVFPADGAEVTPTGANLRDDIRSLVAAGVSVLGRPAARAALPGLLAETAADPTLHAEVLGRFAGGTWGWLHERIQRAVVDSEVRADVAPSTVLELVAGAALVATLIRPAEDLGPEWVEGIVDVVVGGIAP